MSKTVASLFGSEADARMAIGRLEDTGVSDGNICLFGRTGDNRYWTGSPETPNATSPTYLNDDIVRYLTDNGVPDADAHASAEGVRRGNTLVAVRCSDNEVDTVVGVLDSGSVLDIDKQQDSWRSEGWRGYEHMAPERRTAARVRSDKVGRDEVIPLVEEELHVGKRDVGHGRVRITSHIVERPVEEQVTLRNERVEIERRPADSAVRSRTSDDLFRERSIEAEEHIEEPVVTKRARVNEELVVRKDTDQRTETISDTVRKTEVDVEDERREPISKSGSTGLK